MQTSTEEFTKNLLNLKRDIEASACKEYVSEEQILIGSVQVLLNMHKLQTLIPSASETPEIIWGNWEFDAHQKSSVDLLKCFDNLMLLPNDVAHGLLSNSGFTPREIALMRIAIDNNDKDRFVDILLNEDSDCANVLTIKSSLMGGLVKICGTNEIERSLPFIESLLEDKLSPKWLRKLLSIKIEDEESFQQVVSTIEYSVGQILQALPIYYSLHLLYIRHVILPEFRENRKISSLARVWKVYMVFQSQELWFIYQKTNSTLVKETCISLLNHPAMHMYYEIFSHIHTWLEVPPTYKYAPNNECFVKTDEIDNETLTLYILFFQLFGIIESDSDTFDTLFYRFTGYKRDDMTLLPTIKWSSIDEGQELLHDWMLRLTGNANDEMIQQFFETGDIVHGVSQRSYAEICQLPNLIETYFDAICCFSNAHNDDSDDHEGDDNTEDLTFHENEEPEEPKAKGRKKTYWLKVASDDKAVADLAVKSMWEKVYSDIKQNYSFAQVPITPKKASKWINNLAISFIYKEAEWNGWADKWGPGVKTSFTETMKTVTDCDKRNLDLFMEMLEEFRSLWSEIQYVYKDIRLEKGKARAVYRQYAIPNKVMLKANVEDKLNKKQQYLGTFLCENLKVMKNTSTLVKQLYVKLLELRVRT